MQETRFPFDFLGFHVRRDDDEQFDLLQIEWHDFRYVFASGCGGQWAADANATLARQCFPRPHEQVLACLARNFCDRIIRGRFDFKRAAPLDRNLETQHFERTSLDMQLAFDGRAPLIKMFDDRDHPTANIGPIGRRDQSGKVRLQVDVGKFVLKAHQASQSVEILSRFAFFDLFPGGCRRQCDLRFFVPIDTDFTHRKFIGGNTRQAEVHDTGCGEGNLTTDNQCMIAAKGVVEHNA